MFWGRDKPKNRNNLMGDQFEHSPPQSFEGFHIWRKKCWEGIFDLGLSSSKIQNYQLSSQPVELQI